MKNFLLLISLCLFSVIADAKTYYVSPTGSDSNPGTLASPFKNWEKLSSVMHAGDIAYIRGGTYTSSHPASYGVHCLLQNLSGTSGSPIIIQNYAGEYPVLDLSGLGNPTASDPTAFYMLNCTYVTIKGLRITGLKQILNGSGVSRGMELWSSPNCTIEQVEIDHIGGFAFHLYNGSNDILVKNCDVHHIDDRYSVPDAWGAGDGFGCTGGDNSTRTTYDGCRAWWCSDDGWDNFGTNAIVTYKNCWSFWNGYEPGTFTPRGNGEGFKLGPTQTDQTGTTLRFLNNCLSFHNADNGFDQNGTPTTKYQLENCTAYDNASWGFQFQYWPVSAGTIQHVFRNNAALGNGSGTLLNGGSNTYNDHNTWNGGVTISSTDFLSVSSTGVDGARQADGSLPSLNFLKLASSSDLINKGVNVGLSYVGSAPDLGAFEFGAVVVPVTLVNFSAIEKSGKTLLQWSTATELNSSYFAVERSTDGINFEAIGTVNANGNSNTLINYQLTDNFPENGINYYRLKMVDIDGQYVYSRIVSVNFKDNNPGSVEIKSATIINKTLQVNIISKKQQPAVLGLYDAAGRGIFVSNITLEKGINNINKSVTLASAVYYAKLTTTEETITVPLLNGQ